MNLASLIKTDRERKPPRIVLHGVQGIGKSTFGANAINPIFLPTEDGLTSIDVPHFPVALTLEDVWNDIGMLLNEEHEYKTFVLDTADWLERLIWQGVCDEHNIKCIEDMGYGKGYIQALRHWDKFFTGIEKLREKGMAILILAHSEIKTFSPPDADSYDRYQIKIHRHAASKLEEWADVVLFANFQVFVDDKKAASHAERMIYTTNRPAWRAKTRYALPDTLPMDFNALLTAIKGETNNG